MKTKFISVLVFIAMIGTVATFSSCKKKGCTDEKATNYDEKAKKDDGTCVLPEPVVEKEAATPENPSPTPSDADAVFVAVQTVNYTVSPIGTIETVIGIPIAIFIDGAGFKDVGAVTCETKVLDKQDNKSYVYAVSATNVTGISYSGTVDWDVAGGNGFPALSESVDGTFPSNVELTVVANEEVSIGSTFTLSTKASINDADSIIFSVYGPDGSATKTLVGTSSSHTFSASEMTAVGVGSGFVQIAAYRYAKLETLNTGEVLYFINEKVNTTVVKLK